MRSAMWLAALSLAIAHTASGASIALFPNNCASCNLNIPDQGSGTFYIMVANLSGDPYLCGDIYGAEFSVAGLPPGWFVTATPTPLARTETESRILRTYKLSGLFAALRP